MATIHQGGVSRADKDLVIDQIDHARKDTMLTKLKCHEPNYYWGLEIDALSMIASV